MNHAQMSQDLLARVCCGNAEAMDFLANHWSPYVHRIDDIEDGDVTDADGRLAVGAQAAMLFSHPFYLRNLERLREIVLLCTGVYAQAVKWEKSSLAWQRDWADHNRHVGMEMVVAVARICAGPANGYAHGEAIRAEQTSICYHEHHDRNGKAI